jgi:hypothetical protein
LRQGKYWQAQPVAVLVSSIYLWITRNYPNMPLPADGKS